MAPRTTRDALPCHDGPVDGYRIESHDPGGEDQPPDGHLQVGRSHGITPIVPMANLDVSIIRLRPAIVAQKAVRTNSNPDFISAPADRVRPNAGSKAKVGRAARQMRIGGHRDERGSTPRYPRRADDQPGFDTDDGHRDHPSPRGHLWKREFGNEPTPLACRRQRDRQQGGEAADERGPPDIAEPHPSRWMGPMDCGLPAVVLLPILA